MSPRPSPPELLHVVSKGSSFHPECIIRMHTFCPSIIFPYMGFLSPYIVFPYMEFFIPYIIFPVHSILCPYSICQPSCALLRLMGMCVLVVAGGLAVAGSALRT